MGSYSEKRLLSIKLSLLGFKDVVIDDDLCLTHVGSVASPIAMLPCGLVGLRGYCLSGLPIEVLALNKELEIFDIDCIVNCNNLKELRLYKHQLDLVRDIEKYFKQLTIIERSVL